MENNNEKITREQVDGINIKYIEGTGEMYAVSTKGIIYSFTYKSNGKRLRHTCIGNGYPAVAIRYKGDDNFTAKYIHRLVLEAFVPNNYPKIRKYCNHIDENKLNNDVSNLEWVSASENCSYGTRSEKIREGLKKYNSLGRPPRRVAMIDPYSEEIVAVFSSIKEAARFVAGDNFNSAAVQISNVCSGKKNKKTARGYLWKFLDEQEYIEEKMRLADSQPESMEKLPPKGKSPKENIVIVTTRVLDPASGIEYMETKEYKPGEKIESKLE